MMVRFCAALKRIFVVYDSKILVSTLRHDVAVKYNKVLR